MKRNQAVATQKTTLERLAQATAAWLIGRTPRALRDSDAPRQPDGTYSGPAIVAWFVAREAAQTDPLLGDGDSPGLERYRQAKADLAELEVARQQGALIDVAKLRGIHSRWAAILRRAGEELRRHHGNEAENILAAALAECQLIVDSLGDGNPQEVPTDAT